MHTIEQLLTLREAVLVWPALAWLLALVAKSTLLLAVVLVIGLILRPCTAATRHLLLCMGIVTLTCLPVFIAVLPSLEVEIPAPASTTTSSAAIPATVFALAAVPATAMLQQWWRPAAFLYLAGVATLLLYTFCGIVRLVLLGREAKRCRDPRALQLLEALCAEELADCTIRLLVHPTLRSPLSWGLLHPVIVLPLESASWPAGRLRHVIQHEFCHLRRLDWVTQLTGRYACALYWYNPLVWLVARNMYELAEQACDDAVLLADSHPADYAQDLLDVARSTATTHTFAQAMAGSFLGNRVTAILDTARQRRLNDSVLVIRGLLLSLCVATLLAALSPVPGTPFARLGTALSRFITVKFLPEAQPTSAAPYPVQIKPEVMLLSTNLPPLETVYVQHTLRTEALPVGAMQEKVPVITFAEPARGDGLQLLQKGFPAYPPNAANRGIEGSVTIEYDLTAGGQVSNPVVLKGTSGHLFDRSALDAIAGYRYQPPMLNGKPVGIKGLRTRFVYRLNPDPG